MTDSARILVVDNYDSFVYTIVGYLKTLGATVTVVRNDAIDPSQPGVIDEYDGVLISPGPGAPAESGASEDMIRLCAKLDKPMFGVCLGMQALADLFLKLAGGGHGLVNGFLENIGRGAGVIIAALGVIHAHAEHVEMAIFAPGHGDGRIKLVLLALEIGQDGQNGLVAHGPLLSGLRCLRRQPEAVGWRRLAATFCPQLCVFYSCMFLTD